MEADEDCSKKISPNAAGNEKGQPAFTLSAPIGQPFPKCLLALDLKMCKKLLHLLRFFFPGAFEDLHLKEKNSIFIFVNNWQQLQLKKFSSVRFFSFFLYLKNF